MRLTGFAHSRSRRRSWPSTPHRRPRVGGPEHANATCPGRAYGSSPSAWVMPASARVRRWHAAVVRDSRCAVILRPRDRSQTQAGHDPGRRGGGVPALVAKRSSAMSPTMELGPLVGRQSASPPLWPRTMKAITHGDRLLVDRWSLVSSGPGLAESPAWRADGPDRGKSEALVRVAWEPFPCR